MPVSMSMNSVHSNQSSDASASEGSIGFGPRYGTSSSLVELGEDIIVLANYVKSLREALGKIKRVFNIDQTTGQMMKPETRRIQAHERLGQVLRILRLILEKFPAIRSTELLMAAGNMIKKVKEHKYEVQTSDTSEIFDGIDQLAAAFSSRLQRKMETFGTTSQAGKDTIPTLVAKCVMEIDARGVEIKGLYRVSGVKSKVEKLWQAFENGPELVDLSDVHPNVIANVLKLYFRQLPEPLLTFRLYQEFVKIAKEYPSPKTPADQSIAGSSSSNSLSTTKTVYSESELQQIHKLSRIVAKLPRPHFLTLGYLIHHLKRVSDQSAINNMPASNLGIVFGPTLLRTSDGGNSLSSLVDTVHQTRVIDLLITFSSEVFGAPFRVNAQGQVLGSVQEDESISNSQVTEISGRPGSSRSEISMVPGQPTAKHDSDTRRTSKDVLLGQTVINNNNNRQLSHGRYSTSTVITLAGQKISTGNFNPIKSASVSTMPMISSVSVPLKSSGATSPDSESSSESPSDHRHQSSLKRTDINELRKQFFAPTPAEEVTYFTLPRKESTDGGSTTDEDLISSLTASGNHAKLKRTTEGSERVDRVIVHQDIMDDHNPQYTAIARVQHSASNPRLRFLESEMLSRSASASSPFSPRPEQNPTKQRPKFV